MRKLSFSLCGIVFLLLCAVLLFSEGAGGENQPLEEPAEAAEELFSVKDMAMSSYITGEEYLVPVIDRHKPNNELEEYLYNMVEIDGDHVTMRAEKHGGGYISGKVESKLAMRYGDFTFRVYPVNGEGLFPAIWFLPANAGHRPEIDIYENLGDEPSRIYGVYHYSVDGQHLAASYRYDFPENDMPESYEVRFHWTDSAMEWYVNDELQMSITENVPNSPMFFIMNLAVGGDWPGAPTEETKFPAVFRVDVLQFEPVELYVR